MLRRQLDEAEQALENRHDRFDREDREIREGYERYQRREPGFETELQISHRHLRETQPMTRHIIEAVAELADKKEQLMKAGIQVPGSDVESGFVDREDDGYLISGEQDGEELPGSDPGILKWLQDVSDPPIDPTGLILADQPPAEPKDVHRWKARKVQIWENASVVAEGPQRRRIDRWRARAQATGTRAEGSPPFSVPLRVESRGWSNSEVVGLARWCFFLLGLGFRGPGIECGWMSI